MKPRAQGRAVRLIPALVLAVVFGTAAWIGAGGAFDADEGEWLSVAKAGDKEKSGTLRMLQERIEREQRAVMQVDEARGNVVEHMRALEQTLAEEERSLLDAEREVRASRKRHSKLERESKRLSGDLETLESRLAGRLRALYKLGEVGYFRILFSSQDYRHLARRSLFMKRIIASDAALMEDFRSKLSGVRTRARALEASGKELEENQRAASGRRVNVMAWRQEKVALLAQLSREREARLATIQDLARAAEELQGTVEELRELAPSPPSLPDAGGVDLPRGAPPDFRRARGSIPMPVDGIIVKRFGMRTDPQLGTQVRSNGITMRAPYGEGIRAVFDGRVLYAGWFRGYGRILIMDHGQGYYTLLAHASELLKQVGDEISQGEIVARVGESGSLDGSVVYFEIREQGKPVDPLSWIQQ